MQVTKMQSVSEQWRTSEIVKSTALQTWSVWRWYK